MGKEFPSKGMTAARVAIVVRRTNSNADRSDAKVQYYKRHFVRGNLDAKRTKGHHL
jgi:hypothetical protein